MTRHHPEDLETHEPLALVGSLADGVGAVDSVFDQGIIDKVDPADMAGREDEVPVMGVAEWREDSTSVSSYGGREHVIVDSKITSTAEAQARADAVLDLWSDVRVKYKVTCRKTGARAGMDLRIVCMKRT